MLILQGTLRSATTLGGGTNRKTGEIIAPRPVLQVEAIDNRGLVEMITITVPVDAPPTFADKVGQVVNVPVRAWAPSPARVGYVYETAGAA